MKMHVGSGSVYLREWVNVDIPGPYVFLARERADLVEQYSTTEGNYYGRHNDKDAAKLRPGPLKQDTVCDVYGTFTCLPARPGTVAEILARQAFEHLDRKEAVYAIQECARVLVPGGILRIDIPDPDATLRKYLETGEEFYIRHLFGPRRDVYGSHVHYTRQMLIALVTAHGFNFAVEEENIHWYPAFCLRFARA